MYVGLAHEIAFAVAQKLCGNAGLFEYLGLALHVFKAAVF